MTSLGKILGLTPGGTNPIMSSKLVLYGSPMMPEFVNVSSMSMFTGDGDHRKELLITIPFIELGLGFDW